MKSQNQRILQKLQGYKMKNNLWTTNNKLFNKIHNYAQDSEINSRFRYKNCKYFSIKYCRDGTPNL